MYLNLTAWETTMTISDLCLIWPFVRHNDLLNRSNHPSDAHKMCVCVFGCVWDQQSVAQLIIELHIYWTSSQNEHSLNATPSKASIGNYSRAGGWCGKRRNRKRSERWKKVEKTISPPGGICRMECEWETHYIADTSHKSRTQGRRILFTAAEMMIRLSVMRKRREGKTKSKHPQSAVTQSRGDRIQLVLRMRNVAYN